jgi:hypothetical protein
LEESYFDFDSLAEQEKELQKNLVKDVFFSPSIQESHAPCLLSSSCSSSQSGGDDNYSLMSDSSLTCASSPPYQYDDMVASVIDNEHNTTSSFSCTPQSCNDTEQFIFPCHLDLYHSVKDFEEPRPTTAYNNNNRSKKKTVKKPLVKTISNKTKKPRKSTKKTILSKVAVTNIQSTDTR